jgi:4-hydroxybenzoate polyprenyltransferase/phosphoserine phosphatase
VAQSTANIFASSDTRQVVAEFLCADFDGTILDGNSLWESFLALIGAQPWCIFLIPLWLLRGRAALKKEVAKRAVLNVSRLNYREDVINFLRQEKIKGRKLILATGADEIIAAKAAEYLGLFDIVLASDGKTNLTGRKKQEKIEKLLGGEGFDYIGNSTEDIPIWTFARSVLVVGPSAGFLKTLQKTLPVEAVFEERKTRWVFLARALRPQHWVKNLLVFVPLVMAHEFRDLSRVGNAMLAFASFSLCASAVYVLNDLLDLEADRGHPTKRFRAFASGSVPLWAGVLAVPVLLLSGLAVASLVPSKTFFVEMCVYIALTTLYSIYGKRVPIADVILLTGLYLLRILVGGLATGLLVSEWLLAFSMFLLLSLAFTKRYTELSVRAIEGEPSDAPSKRNYRIEDTDLIRQFGVTSGYISVMVLALYVNSHDVTSLYRRPEMIWLACPLLLFWISRVWLIANRGDLHEDPVVFATRDPVSYLLGFIILLILLVAS